MSEIAHYNSANHGLDRGREFECCVVAQFQASGALTMGITCRLPGRPCGVISATPLTSPTLSRRWNCKLGFAHNPQNRGIQLLLHDCRDLHSRLRKPHLLFPRILTQSPISASSRPSISATGGLAMASGGIFDLEKQFAQYGAYHTNKINILIHAVFVWPIMFTAFTLAAYSAPLAPQTPFMAVFPYHEYMVLNLSFVAAAVYALFYIALERKSGSVAAFLVLCCWVGANAVAQHVPYSLGWKIVAVSQVVCWSFQFIGHGVFEGRAPALLDNLAQAFLMAPYFVLLEVLHSVFHYEPYSGFTKSVQNKVGVQITEFRTKKAKAKAKRME